MRFAIGLTFVLALFAVASQATEPSETKIHSVSFDGNVLVFAFEGKTPGSSFQEFIPKGETLENWTKLVGVYRYPHVDDPMKFAQKMARMTKHQYPLSQFAIISNENKGAVILDFVAYPRYLEFVEYNVWMFQKNGTYGLIAYQYAVRDYENPKELLSNVEPLRQRLRKAMIDDGLTLTSAAPPKPRTTSDLRTRRR